MVDLVAVGVGGCLGSVARYLVSDWADRLAGGGFPLGTLLVNVLGCFAIGCLVLLIERGTLSEGARRFCIVGILGGFTTFSAFGNETLQLISAGLPVRAAASVAANVVVGVAAVWLGRTVAAWF